MRLERFCGPEVAAVLGDLAALRVAVFRGWPYLYEGSPDYEADYLRPLTQTPHSLAVIARNGAGRAVGATTALPLAAEVPELQVPFHAHGFDVAGVYYLAESVVLPEYRGHGLGGQFFDEREVRARELGYRTAAFCAVQRPEGDPRRPAEYRAPEPLWARRGYTRRPDLRATLSWPDLGEQDSTPKPMTFWLREL